MALGGWPGAALGARLAAARITWRWAWVGAVSALLPLAVWADAPAAAGDAPAPASTPAQAASANTVAVRGFRFRGHSLLADAQLQPLVQPFLGNRNLAELQAAATAVQRAYAQAGYGGVAVFLAPQTASDGIIELTVLEGRLARVQVQGKSRASAAQVLQGLPSLLAGQTPRLRALDQELQLANEHPARRLELLLKPGGTAGEVDAVVSVHEGERQALSLSLDNTGAEATGRWRLGLLWRLTEITGPDDSLSLQWMTAPERPEQVQILGAGWRVPVYRFGGALELFASVSDVDGGTTRTVAGDLSFAGRGRVAGLRWTAGLPRWGEIDQRWTVSVDQRAYLNECRIEGLPEGACGAASQSVSVRPVAVDYALRAGGDRPWALQVGLHHNLGGGRHGSAETFEAVRPGSSRRYALLRAQAQLRWPLLDDWALQARAQAQWGRHALVPGEQFGLGGAQGVRGYEEREASGDRGWLASLELASPAWTVQRPAPARVSLSAFADAGRVQLLQGGSCATGAEICSLASAGLAARVADAQTQLQLSAAMALREGPRTARDQVRLHASLAHRF